MKTLIVAIAALLLSTALLGQGGVSGTVTGPEGKPLSFATIFVKETGSGTATNEKGKYEIRLKPGGYTLIFQFLGYETQAKKIAIGNRFEQLNVTLGTQALELEEVDVLSGREDPAYTVMRKAIAKASYHRKQLDAYSARVYIKGTGRLKKAPFFLRKRLENEGIDSSFAFTSESVSEISYERPGKFTERVISIYTTGDDNNSSPNSYINGSFYEPKIGNSISPLSPRAFAYYRFEYEGFFMDRGRGVNKIKVIPRSEGDGVFEGSLYIVEGLWSIHSLSLGTINQGFRFDIDQVYAPVQERVWMPVSHKFDVEGTIMGFTVEYNYLATVSDYEVTLNPDLDAEFELIDEKIEEERAAAIQESTSEEKELQTRLETGGELTRKEMRQLMREYAKAERKKQEEPQIVEETNYTVDSMAYKRDSVYWDKIRPVPLTEIEERSYQLRDSIAKAEAEEEQQDSLEGDEIGKIPLLGPILGGKSYRLGANSSFSHKSIVDKTFFNPVEGFSIHTNFVYANNRGGNAFQLTATPRYAFSRKAFTGKGLASYEYGPENDRHLTQLEGGRYIYQYNHRNPISFFFSSYVNLFRDVNYIRLYEKDFLKLSHRHALAPNWDIHLSGEWAKRYSLKNTTTQVWFNEDNQAYASNYPRSNELGLVGLPEEEGAMILSGSIVAEPWKKYRLYNGERQPIANSSPELRLTYRQGLSGLEGSVTDYSYLEAGISQTTDIGVRGTLDYKLQAGIFLQDDYIGFADYRHFMGNELNFVTADPVASYRLLPYYQFSTRDRFASVFLHYQFRQLLLTQIPEVWLLGLKENVFVNTLSTPDSGNYLEVGYSIDNILRLLRLELAFSFDDSGYRDWGILIGFASSLGGFEIQ